MAGPLDSEHRSLTVAIMAALAIVAYNNLSVTAGLPAIGRDLGSVDRLPWVVTVELLAAAIATLAFGPLIDTYGVRAVFRVTMLTFIGSSLVCALAPTLDVLLIGRVGQGISSGGVLGSALAAIGLSYAPELRPRVYAANSTVWGVMGVAGPALAALLLSAFDWRAIFSAIIPLGVAATGLSWSRLPGPEAAGNAHEARNLPPLRLDGWGLLLISACTIALLAAASEVSLVAGGALLAAVAFFLAYRRYAQRVDEPIVQLRHLLGPKLRFIHFSSTLAVGAGTGAGAYLPVYLNGSRGLSTAPAAFSVFAIVLGWTVASWVTSRLLDRYTAPTVIGSAAVVFFGASSATAAAAALNVPVPLLLLAFFFNGTGVGSITSAGLALLQSRAAPAEMGRVSAAHQFLRSLGFAYGAALAGLVLFTVVRLQIDDVEAIRQLLDQIDEAPDSPAAAAALRAGFVWAQVAMAAVAAGTLYTARQLTDEVGDLAPPKPADRALE